MLVGGPASSQYIIWANLARSQDLVIVESVEGQMCRRQTSRGFILNNITYFLSINIKYFSKDDHAIRL